MKKIPNIDGYHHCPLRLVQKISHDLYVICNHAETEGRTITSYYQAGRCPSWCPLPEDN